MDTSSGSSYAFLAARVRGGDEGMDGDGELEEGSSEIRKCD